ncbi:MAG: MMPL family transporter, partial [Sphingomonadales bacterium]
MIRIGTKTLTRLLTIWIDFVLAKARLVVGLSILITGLLFYYTLTHFSINTDTDRMIDPSLDFRIHYAEFNAAFPQLADSFIIVIDAPTPEEAELAANHLLASLEARSGLFKNPYAPGLGAFWDQNGFLFLKIDELVALSDRLAEAQPVLSALAEDTSLKSLFDVLVLATEDAAKDAETPEGLPEVLGAMAGVSEATGRGEQKYLSWVEMFDPDDEEDRSGARRRIVMVQPVPDFSRLQPAKPALLEARRLAREVQEASGGALTVRITGKMALGTDELKSVSDGILLSGIVSLILVALVLGFGIRSIRLVAASLITLLSGLIWTAAFAIFTIGYLNIISVAFAVLFIGLGIDFAIHFSLRYREEVVKGKETLAALRETALRVGGPLSLAAPTTALAFYAFTPTAYAGLAQLGLISGTGMFISLFTSLSVLPALLAMMPLKHSGRLDAARTEPKPGWIVRHARPVALGGLAAGLFAAFFLGQVRFDEDPIRLKDPNSESVEAYLDLLEDSSSSPYAAQIVTSDAARQAELKTSLKALPEVDRVVSLSSFVPKDQDEKLDLLFDVSAFMTPVLFAEPAAPTPVEEAGAAMAELIAGLKALAKARPGTELAEAATRLGAALSEGQQGGPGFLSELETALLRFFPATIEKLDAGLSAEGVALADLPSGLLERYQTADGRQRLV